MSYSDHEAVATTLVIDEKKVGEREESQVKLNRRDAVSSSINLVEKALQQTARDQILYMGLSLGAFILFLGTFSELLLIDKYGISRAWYLLSILFLNSAYSWNVLYL